MSRIRPILLLPVLALTSCEGFRCSVGTVRDAQTHQPLDSVLLEVLTKDNAASYTDSTGRFDVCNRMNGCVPDCKDIVVQFSKPGYVTQKIKNLDSADVLLVKE